MTVRADRLTKRAKTPDSAGSVRSSYPAGSVRVFVHALEGLGCCMEPLLADAGIRRADLDDPDARIPRRVWDPLLCRALAQRPMKNAGVRMATVTPLGAFPLVDYLVATSENVGEGLTRLARYLRLADALGSTSRSPVPIRTALSARSHRCRWAQPGWDTAAWGVVARSHAIVPVIDDRLRERRLDRASLATHRRQVRERLSQRPSVARYL
jgi:Arabinose-binding domain of AraC transcription regulator, N-term